MGFRWYPRGLGVFGAPLAFPEQIPSVFAPGILICYKRLPKNIKREEPMKRWMPIIALGLLVAGCNSKGAPTENAVKPTGGEAYDKAEGASGGIQVSANMAEPMDAPRGQEMPARERRPMPKSLAPMVKGKAAPMVPLEAAPPADGSAEEFTDYGVNPWTDTAVDAMSTFAIDVDTGSYTIARRKIMEGQLPPKESVRVEEFVNYFRYDYPNPESTFAVHLEGAPSPFSTEPNRYLVRVGVQGKRLEAKERKPIHLTFLVDVSGSMNSEDKLPLAVKALKILTNNLKPKDTVAIVTYAGNTAKVLDPTGAENRGAIFEALESLGAGGGTGMDDGMKAAYELAMKQKHGGETSRVIVLSDGDANIGRSSHEEILKQIEAYVSEGVTMSTIGLGNGNYKDTMMEQLANKGNGNYYYIDSIEEARKVFGDQLDGTLQVIAKDVKLQVEFDPKKVKRYRLIGYENRDIADKDFRNDKVDAGELGAGHTVTALYELELAGAPEEAMGTVRVRHKTPDAFKATEDAFPLNASHFQTKLGSASNDFQFAASVAAFAELLRGRPHVKGVNYAWVLEIATGASSPNQVDRQQFLALVKKAQTLK